MLLPLDFGAWLLADLMEQLYRKAKFEKLVLVSIVQNNGHLRTEVQVLELNEPVLNKE